MKKIFPLSYSNNQDIRIRVNVKRREKWQGTGDGNIEEHATNDSCIESKNVNCIGLTFASILVGSGSTLCSSLHVKCVERKGVPGSLSYYVLPHTNVVKPVVGIILTKFTETNSYTLAKFFKALSFGVA